MCNSMYYKLKPQLQIKSDSKVITILFFFKGRFPLNIILNFLKY
jgi:hypothetical protein